MKTRFENLLLAMLAFAVITAASINPAYSQIGSWPVNFADDSEFYSEISTKFLDRPGTSSGLPLVADDTTNQTLFSSDQISDLGGAAGAEVRFGKRGRYGRNWQIRTSLVNWNDEAEIVGANLSSPLAPGFSPDQINTNYESRLFSLELSFRRSVRPGLTLFAGPRYVSLKEDLVFQSDTFFPPPGGPFDLDTLNTLETRNNMYGIQVGGELALPIARQLFFNGVIRAGGYGNPTRFRSSSSTTLLPDPVETEFSNTTGSFIGEVGARFVADLIPGCVSSHIGYEATWIDGVALAPSQFSTNETGQIVDGVTPFFHGITFGLGFRR